MTDSILVTGANGLVGRATLGRLGSSARIYALVRKEPETPLPGDAVAIIQDLRVPRDPELPETPSTTIHLAQSPRYRDFPKGAIDVFDVNVAATQRLLDWGSRVGVRRFVFASSGSVYGHGDAPFDEEAPLSSSADLRHYSASKRCGELLAEAYTGEMTVIVLRFFCVYGPKQHRSKLIPRLVDSVLDGQAIRLQQENGIRLNPIHVDDAAAAVEVAAGLDQSATINVAGPQILSLREIGMLIGEALGREPRFEVQPGSYARHLIGSTAKMARLLGMPRIGMVEGIRRMLMVDEDRHRDGDVR